MFKTTIKKLHGLIKLANGIKWHEIDYLLNFEFKLSSFYGLPKIHKSQLIKQKYQEINTEYLELENPADLKFRPIVAGPVCETHHLSNLIDILLKPFVQHAKSYVNDDIDFLTHLPEHITEGTLLVSFNVIQTCILIFRVVLD